MIDRGLHRQPRHYLRVRSRVPAGTGGRALGDRREPALDGPTRGDRQLFRVRLEWGSEPPTNCRAKGVIISPRAASAAAKLVAEISSRCGHPTRCIQATDPTPLLGCTKTKPTHRPRHRATIHLGQSPPGHSRLGLWHGNQDGAAAIDYGRMGPFRGGPARSNGTPSRQRLSRSRGGRIVGSPGTYVARSSAGRAHHFRDPGAQLSHRPRAFLADLAVPGRLGLALGRPRPGRAAATAG